MDIREDKIKEEVSSFVTSLQRLLPMKKDITFLETKKDKVTRLGNIHAEAKNVFPKCFIGAKIVILRDIMDKVKLAQQYNFGKSKEVYKCFSQLIHKELEANTADEGLFIDSSGSATATYREALEGAYEMRLTSRIKDLISSETELVFEKENENSLGSLVCSMKDVDPNTLKFVTQWTYKVVPELSVGTEFGFKPLSYPISPDISISARYERPTYTVSSTISKIGFQVCLFKQFYPDLRLGTVISEGVRNGQMTFSLALQKNYKNGSEMKIFIDSQYCGGFTFQKDILFREQHNDIRVLRLIGSTLIDRQDRKSVV